MRMGEAVAYTTGSTNETALSFDVQIDPLGHV
jgi:hypothetical protein